MTFIDGSNTEPLPSLPALASAGADREVLRGDQTQLDATGTWSLSGSAVTLTWQQLDGEPVYLSNANDAAPYFVAPLDEQVLHFELSVDNGAYTVTDTVAITVSRAPGRIAPVVNGGPDQFGDTLDTTDFATNASLAVGVIAVSWDEVTFDKAALGKRVDGYSGPRIYKLTGAAGGLESAPDYVLVFPTSLQMGLPPTAQIVGPTRAATSTQVTLSVTSNGVVTYHWEQTRGAPVIMSLDNSGNELTIDLPRIAQRLAFRVHAYNGQLTSAPSELVIDVIPGDASHPGTLVPGEDVYVRPAASVLLMASAKDPAANGATLAWQQTRGTSVTTNASNNQLSFVSPLATDDLAFVVSSRIDLSESPPAAYRIIVTGDGNSGPRIALCVPTIITALESVNVSARIVDPDGDAIADVYGSTSNDDLIEMLDDVTVSGECAAPVSGVVGSVLTRVFDFTAPASGQSVVFTAYARDSRGTLSNAQVTIAP
ncbi:MAG: hypothetical protein H7Z43_14560 [Clostridia bacterium]|nr:hypothetical protein [Deltaproteobacteria bacterium]